MCAFLLVELEELVRRHSRTHVSPHAFDQQRATGAAARSQSAPDRASHGRIEAPDPVRYTIRIDCKGTGRVGWPLAGGVKPFGVSVDGRTGYSYCVMIFVVCMLLRCCRNKDIAAEF
jgi:hypothetical protein